jgi:hypothetical protein
MPSYARRHQLSRSLIYHIYNRGNARAEIYHSEMDYQHFLQLLNQYKDSYHVKRQRRRFS